MTIWLLKTFLEVSGFLEVALAQSVGGSNPSGIRLTNPLCGGDPNCNFGDVAGKAIDFLLTVAVPLTAIMVLVGGFQMVTAGGDPEKFSSGKKTLLYAAIGFVVVLSAKGVVSLIQSIFN